MFNVRKLVGRSKQERGSLAEVKVKYAFDSTSDNHWARPQWFRCIRMACQEQDSKGIDVVIHTWDVGKIPLQVKSSHRGAEKHRQRYPRIPVIVVKMHETREVIRQKVPSAVQPLREAYLAKRGLSSQELIAATYAARKKKKDLTRLLDRAKLLTAHPQWHKLKSNCKEIKQIQEKLILLGESLNQEILNIIYAA